MKLSASERALSEAIGFDQEVLLVAKVAASKAKPRQMSTAIFEEGSAYAVGFAPGNALALRAGSEEEAEEWVDELAGALPDGYEAYTSEDTEAAQPEAVVLKSTDPYAILRAKGTNGQRYELSCEAIIARLSEWDEMYGLTVTGAAFDWVEFALEALPADVDALIEEFITFCPDLLAKGFNDLGEIIASFEGQELPEELEEFAGIDWTSPDAGRTAFKQALLGDADIYLWWD